MKKLLFVILGLIVLLIAAVIIVPGLIPSEVYKEKIQSQLTKELQRDVAIEGDIKLSVFPVIKAQTGRVVISNPDGFSDETFASMDALDARVKLLPLLSKRVEIASFSLKNPLINLEKQANGSANWLFGDPETPSEPAAETGPFKRDGRYAGIDPAIGKFSLENGAISYRDATNQSNYNITQANMAFSLPSLSKPISIDGDLILNDEPIDIDLKLDTPRDFLDGKDTPLSLNIQTAFADLKADGAFMESQDMAFDLNAKGEIRDIKAIAQFIPTDMPLSELAETVRIDGKYVYDGSNIMARNADIEIFGKLFEAAFKGNGDFIDNQPVLDGALSLDVQDIPKLAALLGQDIENIELAKTLKLKTDMKAEANGFAAEKIDAAFTGDGINGSFKGTGNYGDTLSVSGDFTGDVASISALTHTLKLDMPQAKALGRANAAGFVDFKDGLIKFNISEAKTNGELLNGTFKGSGSFTDSLTLQGDFSGDTPSVSNLVSTLEIDAPQAQALGQAAAKGSLDMRGDVISFTLEEAKTSGDLLNATFSGSGTMSETLSLAGSFSADSSSIPALASAAQMDIPEAAALGRFDIAGKLDMQGESLNLVIDQGSTSGDTLSGNYTGTISKLGDAITLSGNFDSTIKALSNLSQAIGKDIPYSAAIGKVSANGRLDGPVDSLNISGVTASLSEGQLNGNFTGGLSMAGGLALSGNMSADIPSLRSLASVTGTNLPPNTEQGQIYENVSISGAVTGIPAEIKFANAKLALDKIAGTGDFTVDMTGAKPELIGTLDMGELDLRPYIASYVAQNPKQGIQPWSEDTLNLSTLTAVDGTFKITTPKILTNSINMGQTDFTATVKNGVLTASLPQISAYGGLGTLSASVDASGSVPKVSMKVSMDDINSNSLLESVAKFTNLAGEGGTLLEISGEGTSQAAIMKSLDGLGNFKVTNGEIAGVDLSALLTGLDSALTSRSLPQGIGSQYTTKFNDLLGNFTIKDGVVSVNDFNLQAFDADAEGKGSIDLGNQTIDFSLRPRLTGTSANNLAKFGIPLRLKGNFNAVSPSLDTEILGQIVAERAQAELRKRLTNTVGGSAGDVIGGILGGTTGSDTNTGTPSPSSGDAVSDIIGGILGGGSSPQPTNPEPEMQTGTETQAPTQSQPQTQPQTQAPEPKAEPTPEDAINDLFGAILGGSSEPQPEESNTDEATDASKEEEKEPSLEDALGSLFGGGKDD